jgi:hypothetical protein
LWWIEVASLWTVETMMDRATTGWAIDGWLDYRFVTVIRRVFWRWCYPYKP